jgi:two-component system, NtrC family, sensor histidine kinase PilS
MIPVARRRHQPGPGRRLRQQCGTSCGGAVLQIADLRHCTLQPPVLAWGVRHPLRTAAGRAGAAGITEDLEQRARVKVHTLGILRWVYVGRLTLAAAVFSGAVLVWLREAQPETTLLATLGLLGALGMTLAGLWHTHLLRRQPGPNFLYLQVLFDVLLVTLVVHLTGGGDSSFPPLYVLVIAEGALLLPLPGGLLIGALASLLYFADMVWWQAGDPTQPAQLQIVLFAIVAMATAMLGDRLRRTGTALGAVESELRQLRLDTTEMLATIDTGLLTLDAEGRLIYMNGAAEAHLGMEAEQWRYASVSEELDRRLPGLGGLIRATAERREPARRQELRRTSPYGERYFSVRTTVLEREGEPWVTAALQDVTEARHVEELIRRAERLQAVAELGASLAHEIRNPLASIRSAVEQLTGGRLGADDRLRLEGLVVSESDRLSRLLSEFMEFSRIELQKWTRLDVRELAREAIGLVERHPDRTPGAVIELHANGEALEVEGDHDLLHRAVFNLVLNAVQHAGATGIVRVELDRANELDIPGRTPLARPIRVRISDTGPGIPEEDVPRLFDPFFTRREGGTGLGLALVHRAVEAHRGAILVDGGAGGGARFTVYLPSLVRRQ